MKTMRRHRGETQPPVEAVDAETLEMIMAALATDLCDHVDVSDAEQDD